MVLTTVLKQPQKKNISQDICYSMLVLHNKLMKNHEFPNVPISTFWETAKNVTGSVKKGPFFVKMLIEPLGKIFCIRKTDCKKKNRGATRAWFSSQIWRNLARKSRSCSSAIRRIFAICFLGSEYFAQRLNQPFDKNGGNNFFGRPGHVLVFSIIANGNIWKLRILNKLHVWLKYLDMYLGKIVSLGVC